VPEPFDAHEQELHDALIDLNFRFDPDPVLSSELPREELKIPRSAAESNDSRGHFEVEAENPVSPEVLEEIVAGIEQQNLQHQIGTQEQSSAETPDFDKKLLDDLIRNYGEFVASPQAQPIAKEFDGFERAEPRREFAASAAPAPLIHAAVLGQNSQHELDREIKKIIKDYGAVDLYSDGPRITKRRAIMAFVVLGGVLSSIYFFSGPKAETVADPPAVHQNRSIVDRSGAVSNRDSRSAHGLAADPAQVTDEAQEPARMLPEPPGSPTLRKK
jgi:hypothetical protein